jgi:hypothetical protein
MSATVGLLVSKVMHYKTTITGNIMKPTQDLSEDELFDRWRQKIESQSKRHTYHFCKDGIISPEDWAKAQPKILFILKEGRGKDDSRITIRNALGNNKSGWKRHKVLRRVGRWAYGLLNYSTTIPDFEKAREHQFHSPRHIAYINISKTPGGKSTNPTFLAKETETYSEYIKRQIDIINPEIVVLCGVYGVIKKYIYGPDMERAAHRIHLVGNRVFINANHPAARKQAKGLYEQVVCAFHAYKTSTLS